MPVHGLIHARDDNIASSRQGMAVETKGRTSKSPDHTRRRVKQQKHHAEGGRSPNDGKPLEIEGDVFTTGT